MTDRTFDRFSDFWPYYLNQHRHASCRALHYLGTVSLIVMIGAAIAFKTWLLLLLLPVVGYAPSWIGHFLIEKNRPATFGRPFWAAFADFRMFGLAMTGRLKPHLEAAAADTNQDNLGAAPALSRSRAVATET